MAVVLIFVALALSLATVSADVTLPSPPVGTIYDTLPDPYLTKPAFTPNYTGPDFPLAYGYQTDSNKPEQIALFPAVRNGTYLFVQFIVPKKPSWNKGFVYYGTLAAKLNLHSQCDPKRYSYALGTPGAYKSGYIFQCVLGPLIPATRYYYRVRGYGRVFDFMSMPAKDATSLKLGLMADVGQTVNASATYDQMHDHDVDLILFAADLTYADNYNSLTCTTWVPGGPDNGFGTCGMGGYRWDSWGRLIQKMAAYTPVAYIPGNHELEVSTAWNELTPYVAYNARVPAMLDNNPLYPSKYFDSTTYGKRNVAAKSPLFYSLDIGPAHIMGLASYVTFMKYTQQWNWFNEDLCKMNRSATPWFFIFMHTPWYNTDRSHYLEGEPLRVWLEPSVYNASADLVIAGHVHAYERSIPVYDYKADACGPTYVTVGDGGNIEGVAGPFLTPQPAYSAYRELSFGSAVLEIQDATTAVYKWYRNTAGAVSGVIGDTFTLTNKYKTCGPKKPSFC